MSRTVSLYQQCWSDKRYLRMVTCRGECDLSNPERKVLSFLVFKARDKAAVGTRVISKALGLDRRTIWAATRRLMELGLATRSEQGYQALHPLAVRPEWFAAPHEANDWWERPCNRRWHRLPFFANDLTEDMGLPFRLIHNHDP